MFSLNNTPVLYIVNDGFSGIFLQIWRHIPTLKNGSTLNICRERAEDFVLENIIFKERTMTKTRNKIFSYASDVTFFFFLKKKTLK